MRSRLSSGCPTLGSLGQMGRQLRALRAAAAAALAPWLRQLWAWMALSCGSNPMRRRCLAPLVSCHPRCLSQATLSYVKWSAASLTHVLYSACAASCMHIRRETLCVLQFQVELRLFCACRKIEGRPRREREAAQAERRCSPAEGVSYTVPPG